MAKKTKITAANIAKAMVLEPEEKIVICCGANDDAIEVAVKPRLSLSEKASMIRDILSMVFITSDDGSEIYLPEFKQFAFDYEIVNYFTDISLPVNSDKAYDFLARTNLASMIRDVVPNSHIAEIVADANEKIEYHKNELLTKSKTDHVANGFLDVLDAVRSIVKDLDLEQIMNYVKEGIPELKETIDAFIGSETTVGTTTE